MKTKLIILVSVAFLSFLTGKIAAQVNCPFPITSNLHCDIDVTINVLSHPGCVNCITSLVVNLVPGQTHIITCNDFSTNGCSIPACDIEIQVTYAGGAVYTGGVASLANPNVSLPGMSVGCDNGGSGMLLVTPNGAVINP